MECQASAQSRSCPWGNQPSRRRVAGLVQPRPRHHRRNCCGHRDHRMRGQCRSRCSHLSDLPRNSAADFTSNNAPLTARRVLIAHPQPDTWQIPLEIFCAVDGWDRKESFLWPHETPVELMGATDDAASPEGGQGRVGASPLRPMVRSIKRPYQQGLIRCLTLEENCR